MKNFSKTILSVSLLICFVLSASAQVTQIHEPECEILDEVVAKIVIEDNHLFAITEEGVFSQNLDDQGNLIGDRLEKCKLFNNFPHQVTYLAVKGDKVIATTTNSLWDENVVVKSNDGGETWTSLNNALNTHYWISEPILKRGVDSNPDELFIVIGTSLYHTTDFGETWNKVGVVCDVFIKSHPLDSQIIIARTDEGFLDVIIDKYFTISHDRGKTWSEIALMTSTHDAAFHYSNPDIMVISGDDIMCSTDRGETWNITKSFKNDFETEEPIIYKTNFDTRGRDRLYGTHYNTLLYSDDFGANWTDLCKIENIISNFVQRNDKIYMITDTFKAYQIDLSLLEASIDAVSAENMGVTLSVAGDMLKVNAETPVTNIEVYNISGIKLLSQAMTDGAVDIANLLQGTYVARLQTVDGRSLSVKFNK